MEKDKRLYNIWSCMRQRCNNPKHTAARWYHDKGIRLCDEWESDFMRFQSWAFSNGYRDDLTIDRIDSDKGYSPDNCRWIPLTENIMRAKHSGKRNTNVIKRENIKQTTNRSPKGRFMVVETPELGPCYFGVVIKTNLTKPEAGRYIEDISGGCSWVRRKYLLAVSDGRTEGETVRLQHLRHYLNK